MRPIHLSLNENPYGLALATATESLADSGYVASVRAKVVAERDAWHVLLQELQHPYSDSKANFVFFDAGRPHEVAKRARREKH